MISARPPKRSKLTRKSVRDACPDQGLQSGACGNDMPTAQPIPATICIGHEPPSFSNQQSASSNIMRAEV
mgnify:CR=1 FL=1